MGRHTRPRFSRPLIAALGVSILVGSGVYIHHLRQSRAARNAVTSLRAVAPNVLDVQPVTSVTPAARTPAVVTQAVLTQTPTGPSAGPSLLNSRSPAPFAPTTRPTHAVQALTAVPISTTPADHPPEAIKASALISSTQPLADGQAKAAAGDLLGARAVLNEGLLSNRLSAADADAARHALADINKTVIFAKKRFKDDGLVTLYQVQIGDRLSRIADHHNVTWEALCRINGLADARKLRAGQWIKIPNGPFNCVITKSAYRLDLYLGSPGESGSLYVTSFAVGLGKDNSTPTGLWVIAQASKAHPATYFSPRGEGVMAPDDPKNPLGGYWMGLTGLAGNALDKNSYGIHGTIEPESIGKQSSLGCIRLGHDDIALLYDLLVDGKSKVLVKD